MLGMNPGNRKKKSRRQQSLRMKRAERARRRERLARIVNRLEGIQLSLNPQTRHLEPLAEQEKTALEVAQMVKVAQELHRCNQKVSS